MTRHTSGAPAERGQSTVEFAVMIPLVMVVVLAIAQVALVAYGQLAVLHTAREVARAVARDPTTDVQQLSAEVGSLSADEIEIEVSLVPSVGTDSSLVRVHASYEIPRILGGFGILGSYEVDATTSMLVEP